MDDVRDLSDSGENNDGTFSFDDSDRFDDMSLCSWVSDPESVCGNWRGWKRSSSTSGPSSENISSKSSQGNVDSLKELCCKVVAVTLSFETIEKCFPNLPELLQLRIAFWSFPRSDDNIRLYSCLANGHAEEFFKGEQLFRAKAVTEPLQIGFHLSCTVLPPTCRAAWSNAMEYEHPYKAAVVFDRCHVTSCTCTCDPSSAWCSHIVALCLHRIHLPHTVSLKPPVSESLSKLQRDQLQKFSQYLISELPQQLLPYAQELLDQLLSDESTINRTAGAPDPTAGPSADDKNQWWMDEKVLRDNVKKMLSKFCGPGPFVLEEVYNFQFTSTAPPTAAEWSNLLRPLTTHEPEGMWNLLSIVRELFQHRDPNAVKLLTLLTQECLALEQVIVWWFCSRSQVCGRNHLYPHNTQQSYRNNINTGSTEMTKHACASFCDELVVLWRLACLDPTLTATDRQKYKEQLEEWHRKTIEKARNARFLGERVHSFGRAVDNFPGFTMAIEACNLDWSRIKLESRKPNVYSPSPSPTKTRTSSCSSNGSVESLENDDVTNVKRRERTGDSSAACNVEIPLEELDEDINILCARAEALQIHNFSESSCVAVSVAEKILSERSFGADLNEDENSRGNPMMPEAVDFFMKTSLVRATFLCAMLSQDPSKHHLAFKIGLFGLEVPRQPAKSKALEVKLSHKESELVNMLKKLPRGPTVYEVVRERAECLCREGLERVKTVLPIKLALFLFQVLVQGSDLPNEDRELGFKAALSVLKMKADILETEYPMFCEGTRRQRGELALALLDYAKDNPTCLQQVKECLLDKKRHCVDKYLRVQWKHEKNKQTKRTNNNYNEKRPVGFGLPRTASNDDIDVPIALSQDQPSTSKTVPQQPNSLLRDGSVSGNAADSSESRQSSLGSCPSDDAPSAPDRVPTISDESRGGGADSGRDSEGDTTHAHEPKQEEEQQEPASFDQAGPSSRDNYSEGEVAGWGEDHSPGEDWAVGEEEEDRRRAMEDAEVGWFEGGGMFGNEGDVAGEEEDEHSGPNGIPHGARFGAERRDFSTGGKQAGRWDGTKKRRKKNNKSRNFNDNRSLEAEAHFMFELAKKVLMLAGGATPTTSIFGQAAEHQNHNNVPQPICNRSLHLCAFELGLFALGLHNITCFNWLSRTYSAHVSWISTQALELGSVALNILLEQWQGHLTPSEVASIAERASKSNDQSTVQKAAQLALSCLHMAHTLNPDHIKRALAQCKEQSVDLLQQACLAIESAARGGGVYPEVLFEVAHLWEFLYEQSKPDELGREGTGVHEQVEDGNVVRASHEVPAQRGSHEISTRGSHEVSTRGSHEVSMRGSHESHPRGSHEARDEPRARAANNSHQAPQPQQAVIRVARTFHLSSAFPYGFISYAFQTPEQFVQQQIAQQVQHLLVEGGGGWSGQSQVATQLANAYRVGMLALETLGRRTPDDQIMSRNPPCSTDVRWLCSIANKVGLSSLQQFCRTSVNAIHSPFVLHDLALEAAGMMAKSNSNQIALHLRSPSLSPMVQKCLMKFGQCVQQSLGNLPKSEYPEFVELIMHARGAFCMAPGGMTQFNDLLQSVRRSTSKKRDLWQKITAGLAQYQNNPTK